MNLEDFVGRGTAAAQKAVDERIARQKRPGIEVQLTDESGLHCLKLVFQARNVEQPLEIFLHTAQAIDLVNKLSLAVCELHHRDSELLLRLKQELSREEATR